MNIETAGSQFPGDAAGVRPHMLHFTAGSNVLEIDQIFPLKKEVGLPGHLP